MYMFLHTYIKLHLQVSNENIQQLPINYIKYDTTAVKIFMPICDQHYIPWKNSNYVHTAYCFICEVKASKRERGSVLWITWNPPRIPPNLTCQNEPLTLCYLETNSEGLDFNLEYKLITQITYLKP